VNREWDFDYDDVRNRLSTLESVVSEVNKVGCGWMAVIIPASETGTPSEMHTNPKETPAYAPSDASTG
jgi:hypothetical protein